MLYFDFRSFVLFDAWHTAGLVALIWLWCVTHQSQTKKFFHVMAQVEIVSVWFNYGSGKAMRILLKCVLFGTELASEI